MERGLQHYVAPLALTPTVTFSFLDYLLGKGGFKKWGFPPGFEPGASRTTMHCPPMARHPGGGGSLPG